MVISVAPLIAIISLKIKVNTPGTLRVPIWNCIGLRYPQVEARLGPYTFALLMYQPLIDNAAS
jgi:hypothetical protein